MEGLFGGLSRRIRQRWSSSRLASTDRVGGRRRNGLKSFLRDQNGAVAAMVAVSLTVILGFGALTIDMSYAYSTRNLLQVTASSAALAAAPELPNQSQVVAKALEYVEANMPAANHGTVLDNSDVVPGNWDPDTKTWTPGASPTNAVEITARRSTDNDNRLELFLAPILGLGFLDMEASAVAYFRAPTAWDVALVQDVTGTFISEVEDAKDADQALLDCVANNFLNSRMGLTTFSGTAPTLSNPDVSPHTFVPMLPVGVRDNMTNYVAMSDAIFDIQIPIWQNTGASYGTHVGIGIESAIEQLDSYTPEEGIIGQAIVIIGDGKPNAMNNAQRFYSESAYYGLCGGRCSSTELRAMAIEAANEADAKGYDVYAIFYDEENDDVAAQFYEDLVRGSGQFKRTPNSDELDEMMFELCTGFADLELVM
jgi:Flp pilus assembly protein TadG